MPSKGAVLEVSNSLPHSGYTFISLIVFNDILPSEMFGSVDRISGITTCAEIINEQTL
jgi:hypothetical protein